MDPNLKEALEALEKGNQQLQAQLNKFHPYEPSALMENLVADLKARLTQSNMIAHPLVSYQLLLLENKAKANTKLSLAQGLAAQSVRENVSVQLNRSADQRSRAYVQVALFSEKLIVVGAGFLAVSVSILGMITTKLKEGQQLQGLPLFETFLLVLFAAISCAVWNQFTSNRMAHNILMATAKVHDDQLRRDIKFAYDRLNFLKEDVELVAEQPSNPYSKGHQILIWQQISVFLLIGSIVLFFWFLIKNFSMFQTYPPAAHKLLQQIRMITTIVFSHPIPSFYT